MKKLVLFLAILFVSVLCTACINNIAIQELNNKAQEYMQKGDIQSAICRLESSVDLDGSVLETRYNLGVAYISAQDYKKAQTQLEYAIKLKPDFATAYYSLAVAQESDGLSVLEQKADDDSQVEVEVVANDDISDDDTKNIKPEEAAHLVSKLNSAVASYKKYLELDPSSADKDTVEKQVEYLNDLCVKYAKKYNLESGAAQE